MYRKAERYISRKTERYLYKVDLHICYIFSEPDEKFLGSVWLDDSGAWSVDYMDDVTYLPINSALNLLGYPECKDYPIL